MKRTGRLAGRMVHFFEVVDSTNSVAIHIGSKGADPGTLVVAESQDKGRGRLSRQWISPPGSGLYFSLVIRPRMALHDLPKISLAAGLAVCLALEQATPLKPKLKWPNDILLNTRKCGGILVEAPDLTGEAPLVIIGTGLNVTTLRTAFPQVLQSKVTSLLEESGRHFARSGLLTLIVEHLDKVINQLEAGGFADILAAWRERDGLAGATLSWLTPKGGIVTGISLGPDKDGILHIRDHQGHIHEVLSSDVIQAW